ncbi:MAG: hypothetical protein IKS49_02660 [Actinomycetaceae bacterium]|nr:hypothetical protein [Actinomycetaceae bacterium]
MTQQRYTLNKSNPVFVVTVDGDYVMDGDAPKAFTGVAYPDPSNTYLLDDQGNYLLCDGEYLRVSDGSLVSEETSAEESPKDNASVETPTKETVTEEVAAEASPGSVTPITTPPPSYATAATPATPANLAPPAIVAPAPLYNPPVTYVAEPTPEKTGTPLLLAIVIMLLAAAAGVGLGWLLFNVIIP